MIFDDGADDRAWTFPDRYQERLGDARRLLRQAGVPFGLKKH